MASIVLFLSYLIWMIMLVSMLLCMASWLVAVQAIRLGDPKLIQVAFNGRFAFYHLMAGVCLCYLLVF